MEPFFDPVGETAALIGQGRADEVVARCEALIAKGRGGILTHVALGRALVALGRADDAAAALREASLLAPNTAEVVLASGEALAASGALPAAIAEFQRAVRLAPDDGRAYWQIARLWLAAGEPDKAEAAAATAEQVGIADGGALAQLRIDAQNMREAARSDAGYVRHLFDQFAGDYDQRMRGQLNYEGPGILRDLAGLLLDPNARRLDVLDLGCGTGLAGIAFKPIARQLIGVDLSPRMIEKARALKIYDLLFEADVETLPAGASGPFDIAIAADVLVYLGDLGAVFASVAQRLKPGGLWLFTTERGDRLNFERGPKRRYRHSDSYLRDLAAAHGFDVASLIECATRYEAGEAVPSWAAAFRKGR
ncbi:MAG: methyltransferase domain-containing protein [Alphaproteobacteria bacterium]|nr:methyltransferase domain-containing protein [Alphaproteobacteria bacterium]